MKRLVLLYILISIFASCNRQRTETDKGGGDTIALKYAENIVMVKHPGFIVVDMKDPWKEGKSLHRYVIVQGKEVSAHHLPQGTVIKQTPSRTVVFGTAHAALMQMLGVEDLIGGVCDLKYMLLPAIQTKVKSGGIVDCGDAMLPDVEKIVDMQADALLVSPFENSGGYGMLDKLNIPIIECADYMETSPLGRAEWMKFYGLLFNCEAQADSLFNKVEREYLKWKKIAASSRLSPSVITERKTGSTWYVPGGRSTIGIMLKDAGGRYAFSDTQRSGSLPLPFESVLEKAGNADLWLFKYNAEKDITRGELLSEYDGYRTLKAYRDGRIWACNASYRPYFEETPFRPDYLLRDLVILLHPALKLGQLRYFKHVR